MSEFVLQVARWWTAFSEATPYLNTLDEVSHREVVVEENAHQHLHHLPVQLEREVMRQDQLDTKDKKKKMQLTGFRVFKS